MANKGNKHAPWSRHEDSILLQWCVTKGPAFCILALEAEGFHRTESAVNQRCRKLGLRYCGPRLGCFKKGAIPANKGRKMSAEQYAKARPTMFKKGCRMGAANSNYVPIGTETFRDDQYWWVKVAEKKWILKHRMIWEKHNGPIPAGMIIRFIDGNPHYCDIKNLELVTKGQAVQDNRWRKAPSQFSIMTGRAARVRLNKRGITDRMIRQNPKLLELAQAETLLKLKLRKKNV